MRPRALVTMDRGLSMYEIFRIWRQSLPLFCQSELHWISSPCHNWAAIGWDEAAIGWHETPGESKLFGHFSASWLSREDRLKLRREPRCWLGLRRELRVGGRLKCSLKHFSVILKGHRRNPITVSSRKFRIDLSGSPITFLKSFWGLKHDCTYLTSCFCLFEDFKQKLFWLNRKSCFDDLCWH